MGILPVKLGPFYLKQKYPTNLTRHLSKGTPTYPCFAYPRHPHSPPNVTGIPNHKLLGQGVKGVCAPGVCWKVLRKMSNEENPPFHYTGCLIGILIMVYYNPHIFIVVKSRVCWSHRFGPLFVGSPAPCDWRHWGDKAWVGRIFWAQRDLGGRTTQHTKQEKALNELRMYIRYVLFKYI